MLKDKLISAITYVLNPMNKACETSMLDTRTAHLLASLSHNRRRSLRIKTAMSASAVIIFLAALSLWGIMDNHKNGNTGEANAALKKVVETEVSVMSLQRGPLFKEYHSIGTLTAKQEARIIPKASGRITNVLVSEGDNVKAGQLLMLIDPTEYQIPVNNAKSQLRATGIALEKSQRDFERAKKLHEVEAIAEAAYEDARSAYENARATREQARAALDAAQKTLAECSLTSPMDGIVTQCSGNQGELTGPQTQMPVFTIEQMDAMQMEVDLPEEYFNFIGEGAKSMIEVDAVAGARFEGRISRVYPTVNQISKTFRVTISLDNADLRLRSGMTARAKFVMKVRDNVLAAPKEVLLPQDNGFYAYKLSGNVAHKVKVSRGIEGDNMVEVTGGLYPGDRIVTTGVSAVQDGVPVIIRSEQDIADSARFNPSEP